MMYRCLSMLVVCCLLAFAGCDAANPGKWPKETVEAKLTNSLTLTEISLSPKEGGFSGTGVASDGETFKLEITQDPVAKKMVCEATGDRGTLEERVYDLD